MLNLVVFYVIGKATVYRRLEPAHHVIQQAISSSLPLRQCMPLREGWSYTPCKSNQMCTQQDAETHHLSGHTGLDLITDIIIADVTPLKWRGFVSALPSAPFILNAFISAEIVNSVVNGAGWRWGCEYSFNSLLDPC
jgi:hypothetical protein